MFVQKQITEADFDDNKLQKGASIKDVKKEPICCVQNVIYTFV